MTAEIWRKDEADIHLTHDGEIVSSMHRMPPSSTGVGMLTTTAYEDVVQVLTGHGYVKVEE